MRSELLTYAIVIIVGFSGLFALLGTIPVASGAPSSSQSNTATFAYQSETYFTNAGTINSGSVVLGSTESSGWTSINLNNVGSWSETVTGSGSSTVDTFTWSANEGSWAYYGGTAIELAFFAQMPAQYQSGIYYHALGSAQITLDIGGNNVAFATYSPNYNGAGSSTAVKWFEYGAVTIPSLSTGYYTVTLTMKITGVYGGWSMSGGLYSDFNQQNAVAETTEPTQHASSFIRGYTFNGQSVTTPGFTIPGNLAGWDIVNTNVPSGVSVSASGNQLSGFASSIEYSGTSSTSLSSTSYTIDYSTQNAIESHTANPSSQTASATITEAINWFNSTSYSWSGLNDPSGALNGASYLGRNWNTVINYQVSNVLESGYQAKTNQFYISGSLKDTGISTQYYSFTGALTNTFSLSFNTQDFATFTITTIATPPGFSSINQPTTNFALQYSSPIALNEIQVYVLGNLEDRYTSVGVSGTVSFSYSDPSLSPLTVAWEMTTGEYTQWDNLTYGGSSSVPENSSSIIVLQASASQGATQSYPISISGSPSGPGYYQQLFQFSSSSAPEMVSGLNSQASNFLVVNPVNSTPYPTWIESYAQANSIVFWTRLPNGTTQVDIQEYPFFENFLSATGHLGEASYLSNYTLNADNGKIVMGNTYNNFSSTKGLYLSTGWTRGFYYGYTNGTVGIGATAHSGDQGGTGGTAYGIMWSTGPGNPGILSNANSNSVAGQDYPYGGPGDANYDTFTTVDNPQNAGNWMFKWHNATAFSFWADGVREGYGTLNTNAMENVNWETSTQSNLAATWVDVYYTFYEPLNIPMPTLSLGKGQLFIANATTTGSFQSIPGKSYNSTWIYDIYNIPLEPNAANVTVLINQSWIISNLYPSTYKIFQEQDMILFTDLNGFASIELTTIQPNSASLGSSTSISLDLVQEGTQNTSIGYQYYSDFSSSITYTPFGSSSSTVIKAGATGFNLPYGATATIQILDYWHEIVGETSLLIPQSSATITIPLNITLLYAVNNETGALFSSLGLREGSSNFTFPNPMYVKNGSSYEWYVTALNPQTYQNTLYSGTIDASGTSEDINVPVGVPIASLQVEANAFNASGVGQIGSYGTASGNPTAYLYLNGVKTNFGTTFEGTLGQYVSVEITDVLGHPLFNETLILNSPLMSETFNITTPSYLIQFVNQENVNASSPQATQYSSIKVANTSGPYYNFTTHVQQWSQVYLAAGYTYFLSTHDNLTATKYITLTDNNSAWAFNGSNIQSTTEQAFLQASSGLSVTISGGLNGLIEANTTSPFTISVFLQRGGVDYSLNQAQTLSVMSNMSAEVDLNGNFYGLLTPYYITPGTIGVKVNESLLSGGFAVNVTISDTSLDGSMVHGSAKQGFGTVNYNPSNPPKPVTGQNIQSFLESPAVLVLGFISAVIGIIAWIRPKIRAKHKAEENDLNQATLVVEGGIALKILAGQPLTELEQAWWNAIPGETRKKLMREGTAGNRSLFPHLKPKNSPRGRGKVN